MNTNNDQEAKITRISITFTIILGFILAFVIWISAENSIKRTNIKPCEHWVYTYYFRGRMNQDVICADSLYITDRGKYKDLPWYLKEQQKEITRRYHFLMKRLYQADTAKVNLPKSEE